MRNEQEKLAVDEIRQLLQLVAELHAAPARGEDRRERMLKGLCDLLKTDAGESTILESNPRGIRILSSVQFGLDRRISDSLITAHNGRRVLTDPAAKQLIKLLPRSPQNLAVPSVTTRIRHELVTDSQWMKSDFIRQLRKPLNVHDSVYSARQIEVSPRRIALLYLMRRPGLNRSAITRHERKIAHLFHSEAGWVYEGNTVSSAIPDGLTTRQKECLRYLLAGKSEKEIASRLKVSPHTVHAHVKAVYRGLGVQSRAKLMAQFMSSTDSSPADPYRQPWS